jgi:hypothetical protein
MERDSRSGYWEYILGKVKNQRLNVLSRVRFVRAAKLFRMRVRLLVRHSSQGKGDIDCNFTYVINVKGRGREPYFQRVTTQDQASSEFTKLIAFISEASS